MAEAASGDQLESVWALLAERYPLLEPQNTDPDTLAGLPHRLVELFVDLGVPDAAVRVALPADYVRFLAIAGGTRGDRRDWLCIFGPQTMLARTANDCGLFGEDRPAGASLWLTVGHWSDKHDMVLCCDRTDPQFGNVIDSHDDHPWNDGGSNTKQADTFTGYLEYLASPYS